ncbi:cation diffusion facilitator family transporter [Zoogloea sp.]|uniref:cation diffusion facilitator family transporter n=1 Tax=Zoogloea sp. TaxID=49181 RepID=UPI0035AEAEB6
MNYRFKPVASPRTSPAPEVGCCAGHAHDHGEHDGHGDHQDHAHHPGGHSHGHGHGHGHHHHAPASYDRAFAIGLVLNVGFVLVEALYGWQIDSLALLADAGHNLSDVAGLLLAWGAFLAARLAPSPRLTYGWRRASILAALVNAVLLLVAMGALMVEAIQRFQQPAAVSGWTVIVVALVGVVVNGITAVLFMKGSEDDLNLRGAFLHMAADALVSLGVAGAGALYLHFGWPWLDPLVSLLIALVIVAGTWGLLRQSLHLSFDGVPEGLDVQRIHDWLLSRPGVQEVHDLHVWALGTSDTALSAHLVMPGGHPGDDFLRSLATELKARHRIGHPTIQIEIEGIADSCTPSLKPAGH